MLLFACLAIQVKIRAPHMHTYLETIKIRWGTRSHVVFMVFALMCNVIVTSMLLLGGSSFFNCFELFVTFESFSGFPVT